MAEKGWTAQVAAATGVAAGIGAAQLGLGYGLGVVVWPTTVLADNSVWLGSLGWATWIAASSTVFGAVFGSRFGAASVERPAAARQSDSAEGFGSAGRPAFAERPAAAGQSDSAEGLGSAGQPGSAGRIAGPWRFALAVAAAIGALLTVALIALPARSAVRSDTFAPQTVAGGYALIGVLLGLVIAYWAVVSRPVAANLIATASWLWALAVAAVLVEVILHHSSATYLTSWQFADPVSTARYGTIYWPSSLLTMLAALIIGIVAAWPAARRGDFGIGAASSGAVGPLLVAAAFFVLAPQLTGALGPLESAYLVAPYAVLTGLAGSALTVAIGRRTAERRARRRATPARPRRPARASGVAVVQPASANATGSSTATADTSSSTKPRPDRSARRRGDDRVAKPTQPPARQAEAPTKQDRSPAQPVQASARQTQAPAQRSQPSAQQAAAKPAPRPTPAEPAVTTPPPAAARPTTPRPTQSPPSDRPTPSQTGDRPTPSQTGDRSAPPHAGGRSDAASASPAKPEARSTVAPPPDSPAIAQINPPRSDRAGSTRPTKVAPANPRATPASTSPASATQGPPQANTLWVDDADSTPAPEARKRRFGRRPAPTDENDAP